MNIFDEPKIDCHNHLFDPARFPYHPDAPYAPSGQEVATLEQFNRVMDAYGVQHALLVGPNSGYHTDNSCLLSALATGQGRFKGVAVVSPDITLDALATLQAQGVVGVAFNPALYGVASLDAADGLFGKLAELDLFAQIQVCEDQLLALRGLLERTSARVLIDHCGRPEVSAGIHQPGFQALLRLAASGRASVKLSGMQKFASADALQAQSSAYVHALLEAFGPQACVWGSDWPFIRQRSRVDYGPLLKLAEQLMPDAQLRRTVMWDTPRRLFGFA
ncbi:amidohydrolase family protein [Pseudomonas kermanshahensis]|uniref:Amidohydrolase family protein n=1 Tax=Pseudomonas kermanshahensis TaxID=2745482 RepID=A0ABU8R7P9_9PSED|nr:MULTISPECIES: amidohydrolase family protein [unclassified Pseudomonas]ATP49964.1 2-pyrone-4,6-dicarboxylate hydrolase [Pseudomonas putida]MBC3486634.1 amidohydrolase family protein [Pseudomonas sp. SWRI50]MBC3497636.1 amidohydrolase family protein [Pseudomonas sp. SWRI67]MBV4526456.1 amidohydrolase family protein [Pseudomonas kermanshahensis]MDE4538387.1 amidohydrolase family protein [Pseudomonas sp. ITEM 17296]